MKKGSILLVLALLLGMLTFPVSAASAQVSVPADAVSGTVTVTVPADEATVAGLVTVSFDNRVLTFDEATSETDLYSIAVGSSSITIYYSCLENYTGDLATVVFSYCAAESGTTIVSVKTATYAEDTDETVVSTEKLTVALLSGSDTCPSSAYEDVDTGKWYHKAIDYVISNGIMTGTGETTFAPDEDASRAMFVTVLGRLAGVDTEDYTESSYSDVPTGKWYSAYVQWATEIGIVSGYGDGVFAPNQTITRQEMVSILYRFAQWQGVDVSDTDTSVLSSFADADSVSTWAEDAIAWSIANGIISGTDTGIEPKATATRAQIAQVVMIYATENS